MYEYYDKYDDAFEIDDQYEDVELMFIGDEQEDDQYKYYE